MLFNKRGAALLQVLIITAVLAGMSAMILRLTLARTIASRQTRHAINAQTVIESCMAEVNAIWAAKNPEAYARDLAACQMCERAEGTTCSDENYRVHTCTVSLFEDEDPYTVQARIRVVSGAEQPCRITYTITGDARQTL